jgi:hypothetical protein
MDTSESSLDSINSSIDSLDNNNSNSHHSTSSLQFVLNCFLHISILFSFLILLFIIIIGPLAQSAFKSELGHIINNSIDNAMPIPIDLDTIDDTQLDLILSTLPIYSSFPFSKTIFKSNLRLLYNTFKSNPYILNNYIKEYSSVNHLIQKHNDDIVSFGISIVIILYTISIILCITFKYYYPDSINLSKLFIENILTFILIGAGEYWFFMTYAKNFIPAPPSLLSKSAIDNLRNILNK